MVSSTSCQLHSLQVLRVFGDGGKEMATEKRLIYADSGKIAAEYMEKHLIAGDSDFLKGYLAGVKALAEGIDGLPTVDAVEVVHGRWEKHDRSGLRINGFMVCSACNVMIPSAENNYYCLPELNYCPNCGAKMDGDGNE